jgi:hypothetical protein
VFAVVAVVDAEALLRGKHKTLSCAYRDAAHAHPVVVTAATAYLVAHLYGALPLACDPLRWAADRTPRGNE